MELCRINARDALRKDRAVAASSVDSVDALNGMVCSQAVVTTDVGADIAGKRQRKAIYPQRMQ
jgi:hypothetical protein